MQHSELLIDELSCRGSMPAHSGDSSGSLPAWGTEHIAVAIIYLAAAGLHGHHRRKGSGRADNGKSDSASEHATQYFDNVFVVVVQGKG